MQDRQNEEQIVHQVAGNQWRNKSMMKKILICAIIALVLVPASVMAAGFGGRGTAAGSGQCQCLQDGQNCMNPTGQQGSGTQEQIALVNCRMVRTGPRTSPQAMVNVTR